MFKFFKVAIAFFKGVTALANAIADTLIAAKRVKCAYISLMH